MATQLLQSVQYRLTQHYIEKLRQANAVLRYNRDNSDHWFQAIERDWAQIRNWQQWAFARINDHSQCAQLCAAFGTVGATFVSVRQTAPERLKWYQQALQGAQQIADNQKELELLYLVGTTAYQTGNFEEAERCGKRLLELGRDPTDHLTLGYGWFITGNIHSYRTELEGAEAAFRKALAHFEKCHAEIMIGHAVQGIARIMIFRGQYSEALTYAKRYLEIIEAAGRESDFSLAYQTLSNIHTRLGNLEEAKSYAVKGVEISRRLGYMRMIPSSLLILGYAELALNELDAAWDHFQETIAASHVNASKFDFTAATYSLGDVRLRQNNLTEALTHYQQALTVASESRLAAYRSLCSTGIAFIYTLQHEYAAARGALRTAAETALEIKSDILLAKALIPATKLWQETGRLETAAEWSGLLLLHPEHAEQQTVDAICAQLQAEIGTSRYLSAAERGKTLTLKNAVTDVLRQLDQLELAQPPNQ